MNNVICPHCKKTVEISEALRHEFKEQELAKIKAVHEKELAETKEKILAESNKKNKQEFELQLKQITKDNLEKEAQNKKLYEQLEKNQ